MELQDSQLDVCVLRRKAENLYYAILPGFPESFCAESVRSLIKKHFPSAPLLDRQIMRMHANTRQFWLNAIHWLERIQEKQNVQQ